MGGKIPGSVEITGGGMGGRWTFAKTTACITGRYHVAESPKYQGPPSIFWLHCGAPCDIIRHGKQKCGGLRVLAHPQACTGETPPIQRFQPHPQGILYDISPFFVKGGLVVFAGGSILLGGIRFSHCAGLPCAVFLFSPGTPGAQASGDAEGSCAVTVFHGALSENGRNGNYVRFS